MNAIQVPCECCGECPATVTYGEADRAGHTWTYRVCKQCREYCSSDDDGHPVHVMPGWDGSPETFKRFVTQIPGVFKAQYPSSGPKPEFPRTFQGLVACLSHDWSWEVGSGYMNPDEPEPTEESVRAAHPGMTDHKIVEDFVARGY